MTDSAASPAFPPDSIEAFLRLCEGEWMNLRSQFDLGDDADGENGDEWHTSERGELVVTYLAEGDGPGGLSVGPKGTPPRQLLFAGGGSFRSQGPGSSTEGRWQLWPDGSVELTVEAPGRVLRERIWFTQPNLRLRSSVEQGEGGRPGRARFSSEIRRVRKPSA